MSPDMTEAVDLQGNLSVQELQHDLERKYRNVGDRVESFWRAFTPKQREEAMREAVGDGQVLRHSRDPGLGGLRDHVPEWNLRDMTTTPEHFLSIFKFRATTNLFDQHYHGANDGPGDRQFVEQTGVRWSTAPHGAYTFFISSAYGKTVTPKEPGHDILSSFRTPNAGRGVIPAAIGETILCRQENLLQFLNYLVEEILELGSETRHQQKPEKLVNKALVTAVSNPTIQPQPLKTSFPDIVAQAMETKAALEDFLFVLRSEPVVLNEAVNAAYWSRPELVPDELGRILPAITDRHLSGAFLECVTTTVKAIAIWDYILQLLRLLNGESDKIKPGLILQELSNTFHLEY